MRKHLTITPAKVFLATIFLFFFCFCTSIDSGNKQQYFEIRIYHISTPSQESRVDLYLKDALLPALHRADIDKAGVFKPVEQDTAYGKLVYVFIPFGTIEQYTELAGTLANDMVYQQASINFLDAPFDDPPYKRHESILLKAFSFMPQFRAPDYSNPVSERIYELRSYESATEAKAAKKIHMFNEGGEMKIFEDLGFNAVFYGEVLMGSHKPNLMYMTTFRDMKSHDEKWQTFRSSPAWKELSSKEEYRNTVSKVSIYLLHPASYSDF